MTEFLRFALLGLGGGSIYALVALGIVLVYRGSGVVNFANGALSLTGAATFHILRDDVGTGGAIALGVLASGTAGVLVNLLVMSPMRVRGASPLTRVIATLGVASLGTELWTQRFEGASFEVVAPFLPSDPVRPFGGDVVIGEDRLWILGITVVLVTALTLVYRRSRFGLATTAVAENEVVAAAQGWSPVSIGTVNWFLGSALAGFAGIVLATIAGLSITSQTLVIVPALAAALVGGFRSFPMTLAGGLLIGVLESLSINYASGSGHLKGLSTATPFVVIVLLLVVRGRALPLRSFIADRLPSLGPGRLHYGHAVLVAAALGSLWWFSENWVNAMISSCMFGLVALSLIVVTGIAGQLTLTQWTMAGMGALFAGRLAGDVWGLPFPVAVLVGIVITVPVGVLVSLPALRVRGVNLAITTFALALVLGSMVLQNDAYTGGPIRGTLIPSPTLFGWSIDPIAYPERYGATAIAMLALGAILVSNIRRGRVGRRLIVVRDNERAAASLGISVIGVKVYAFAVGSALAGAAGGLAAFKFSRLDYGRFSLLENINVVLLTALGGVGWIAGAIAGATGSVGGLFPHLIEHAVEPGQWYFVVAAAVVVLTIIVRPDGVVPHAVGLVDRLLRRHRTTTSPTDIDFARDDRSLLVEPKRLELRNLTVTFASVVALSGVDLDVEPGQVVGLIGPNGAGKTTLIDATTGFVASSGTVTLSGTRLDGMTARQRARNGITRSFQSLELFEDLSVRDNLAVASDDQSRWSYLSDLVRPQRGTLSDAAVVAIREFGLADVLDCKPSELPYAQRRVVAIARAVAASPSVLLLDEPAAGLDDQATRDLGAMIRRLADEWGMAVLLIEHDVELVMRTCDQIVALNFGEVNGRGTPLEIRSDRNVIDAYLGAEPSLDRSAATL